MLCLFEAAVQQLANQLLGGIDGDDFALVHDGHPVAEQFGLVHVVSGHDDGHALVTDVLGQFPEVTTGLRVEASGRFVHEEDAGAVDKCGGDAEALALAARQLFGVGIFLFTELDVIQEFLGVDLFTVGGGKQFDQLAEFGFVLEGRGLRLDTDDALDGIGLAGNVEAVNRDRTAIDRAHGFDHFQGSGFAGAVRTEDAKDLAFGDFKGDAVDHGDIVIDLAKLFYFENVFAH